MKLLQILLSQSQAGAETFFEKMTSAFQGEAGIEQKLIIEDLPARERRLVAAGCSFETLPMDWFGKRIIYNWKLKKVAREFRPDILFTWMNRASRKAPETTGVTVGRLGGYYKIANFQKCDHLIVNTDDLRRYVMEEGWPEKRVSVIPNFGEYPEALQNAEKAAPLPEIPEGAKVLLALGRLHEKKAHDVLFRAMVKLPECHVLVAGEGELQGMLEELAVELGIRERVHFLGWRRDIGHLFNCADVCVFPSRFEPLGNVVIEAWAAKVPLVAAASVGPSWLMDDEIDGLLFPIDDHEACAERVRALLDDPSLGARLVAKGYEKFRAEFTREVIVGKYRALFERLLAGG